MCEQSSLHWLGFYEVNCHLENTTKFWLGVLSSSGVSVDAKASLGVRVDAHVSSGVRAAAAWSALR